MIRHWRWAVLSLSLFALAGLARAEDAAPIKALLITGGNAHDYNKQAKLLPDGISARTNIVWTVEHPLQNGKEFPGNAVIEIYKKPDYCKGFDIVVHNECYAEVADKAAVEAIVKAHLDAGVPAIVIHGSLHAYRSADKVTDEWRKLLGVTSTYHEAGGRALEIKVAKADHPIMIGIPATWKQVNEELYVITKQWPECVPLAVCTAQDKTDAGKDQPVVWVNTYNKVRVFGTSLGHPNTTYQDPTYLDVMTRGLLWCTDKLDDKGQPKPGYGPKPK
jgi:type 1 glutamine amidotransferase